MGADQGQDGNERKRAGEPESRDREPAEPSRKPTPRAPGERPSRDSKPSLSPLGMRPSWIHWLLPLVLLTGLWIYSSNATDSATRGSTIDYSTFYSMVQDGKVQSVVLRGDSVRGRFFEAQKIDSRSITAFRTRIPDQQDLALLPMLRDQKVTIQVEDAEASGWVSVLVALVPWVLILGAWLFLSRRASKMLGSGGSGLAGFVKTAGRKVNRADVVDVTFEDVAGLSSAKRDLKEVVSFLRNPEPFQRLGGKLPRGVLLVGSPGTGKTLLARAVAGEAGVPFFSISASEFIELFVGVGASRVRDLFSQAKQAAPAIVFIDEIDAVGRSRGTGLGGGHDEREQTLNQLLAEMDGFERSDKVVVLAATNRPDVLDPALLRPGRFDRRVVVELPEMRARIAILEVHTRDKPLMADVALDELAAATPGFSGADLANLCNEAALTAVRRGADAIARRDFLEAQDKIQLGDPSETRLRPDEKRRVAVHETGHAVVAQRTEGSEPLRRVSIIPRGMALGATQQMPGEDKHLQTVSELKGMLNVLMGGFAAEKLLLGEVSSGAEDDLRKATNLAHKMVAQLGMSEKLGPMHHEHRREHPFLGQRIASDGGPSDATLHDIEQEAQHLLDHAEREATRILRENKGLVERMIDRLMAEETLERDALERLLAQPASHHDEPGDPPPPSAGRLLRLPRG